MPTFNLLALSQDAQNWKKKTKNLISFAAELMVIEILSHTQSHIYYPHTQKSICTCLEPKRMYSGVKWSSVNQL